VRTILCFFLLNTQYLLPEKNRGFGFVEFESREDCLAAQENMDKSELFGRVLTVNVARAKAMEKNKAGRDPFKNCNTTDHKFSLGAESR